MEHLTGLWEAPPGFLVYNPDAGHTLPHLVSCQPQKTVLHRD